MFDFLGVKRKRYNGDVAALLPSFGFTAEEAGAWKVLEVLDIAWSQKYSEYEGALFVSYLFLSGIIKEKDIPRSKKVINRIKEVQPSWLSMGLVRHEIANRLTMKADGWVKDSSIAPIILEWDKFK